MRYRIGQKVRLLHDSGEGVIISLIDKYHVEVDLGDDFPIDVHISEIVPVDSSEQAYIAPVMDEEEESLAMGPNLLDLSFTVSRKDDKLMELHIINPERAEVLFTCYSKDKKRFEGLGSGKLEPGESQSIHICSEKDLMNMKGFFFQFISFTPGKGHPHTSLVFELPWTRNRINEPSKYIRPLGTEGWIFSLREDQFGKDLKKIADSEFIRIAKQDQKKPRPKAEIDLHIERLVKDPYSMGATEMLKLQMKTVEKALSDSLVDNYESIVFIHGIGEGKLRKEVHEVLRKTPHVKSFEAADPSRYGNGATIAYFK